MTAGHIYTVAGNGAAGDSGDGGRAVRAALNRPRGVTVDSAGNLVIADAGSPSYGGGHWVRVVAAAEGTFYGKAMAAGDIYTVAGNGTEGYSGDNGPVSRAQLDYPASVAVDGPGNLVIADALNNRIRVAAAVTGTFYGQAMTAGHIYTVAGDAGYGYSGDGGPATSASFAIAYGVSIDHSGNLVIADDGDCRIRVVAGSTGTFYGQAMTAGHIYTVAGNGTVGYSGDGGPATSAALTRPEAVTVDTAGNLVISDTDNQRIRVAAAVTGTFYGLAMTAGDIYTVAGGGTGGLGDGGPATSAALTDPQGVAVDTAGNLFIADDYANRVRMVADSTGTFYGQAMTAGDIYTVAGGGSFTNDGVPATAAALSRTTGVALDSSGNLLIADTQSYRIRVVPHSTGTFYGQAMTAGDIYTLAGQPGYAGYSGDGGRARSAQLSLPTAIAVDDAGNLLIADRGNSRIRMITR